MNIDISKIVEDTMSKMQTNNVVETLIAENFQNSVEKAVTEALSSYKLRNTLEEKLSNEISKVLSTLDFQSYNAFMVEKLSQILNQTCREDLCAKAEQKFKDLFLCQTKEIKLSSVFEKFREIACEAVDEQEKYNRCDTGWHCKCEVDPIHDWINCELDYEDRDHRYTRDCQLAFTVHRDLHDNSKGRIYNLYLDGERLGDKYRFGHLNDVELMLVQAVLNEIPIIIDVDDDAYIDSSFDVDY